MQAVLQQMLTDGFSIAQIVMMLGKIASQTSERMIISVPADLDTARKYGIAADRLTRLARQIDV